MHINTRFRCRLQVASLLAAGLVTSALQGKQQPQAPPATRSATPPPGVHGPSVIPLRIPPRMQGVDLDRYALWLSLSEEQSSFLKDACQAYAKSWDALLKKDASPLQQLSEQAGSAEPTTPGSLGLAEEFVRRHKDLRRSLATLDESLFAQLETVLTDEQIAHMQRVRLDREREVGPLAGVLIPAAAIDLSRLVERHRGKEHPGATAAFESELIQYEQMVTPLVRRLSEALVEQPSEMRRIAVRRALNDDGTPIDPASPLARTRREETRAERLAILQKSAKLQQSIAETNGRFIVRLAAMFPVDIQTSIQAAFNQAAYPAVYPDPLYPSDFFQSVRGAEGLSADEQAALDALWEGFVTTHKRVTDKMVTRFTQWRAGMAETQSAQPAEMTEYRATMRQLRDERWAVDAAFVEAVFAAATPAVQATVATQRDEFRARVTSLEARAKNDSYPGG